MSQATIKEYVLNRPNLVHTLRLFKEYHGGLLPYSHPALAYADRTKALDELIELGVVDRLSNGYVQRMNIPLPDPPMRFSLQSTPEVDRQILQLARQQKEIGCRELAAATGETSMRCNRRLQSLADRQLLLTRHKSSRTVYVLSDKGFIYLKGLEQNGTTVNAS